jgi:hypothetical protein
MLKVVAIGLHTLYTFSHPRNKNPCTLLDPFDLPKDPRPTRCQAERCAGAASRQPSNFSNPSRSLAKAAIPGAFENKEGVTPHHLTHVDCTGKDCCDGL